MNIHKCQWTTTNTHADTLYAWICPWISWGQFGISLGAFWDQFAVGQFGLNLASVYFEFGNALVGCVSV